MFQFFEILFDPNETRVSFGNWGSVLTGILVLIFFGFGSEAISYYRKLLRLGGLGAFQDAMVKIRPGRSKKIERQVPRIALQR